MSALQTLTPAQLAAYLAHLHFPSGSTPTLPQLVTHQLRYVPFESLSLHYSTDPVPDIDISLPALLEKTISGRAGSGRGGYCMEVNTLFGALLRTLGFEVWPTGGRVSNTIGNGGTDTSGGFMGWNHMVNVVADAGKRWLVDVGFGGE